MLKKINKSCSIILATAILLQGCAGKTPHPVHQYTAFDEQMSCDDISLEVSNNQNKIQTLLPKTEKTGKNVGLGVASVIFFPTLFFMDFSDAEKVEIEALQRRNDRLRILSRQKACSVALPEKIEIQIKKSKNKKA